MKWAVQRAWQDSNLRPLSPQPSALSAELQAHMRVVGGPYLELSSIRPHGGALSK